ncbi:MAG TPA: glycosyltransferase family 4 protein [Ktedonosporobacter sp.]|nr:glycosyltransferase family 4 protein [Ktedonosporobacter sp.]
MLRNRSVLLLVENLSVPADPRVWREAQTLRRYGFRVCVICPKGKKHDTESYICLEGIHIYRYNLSVDVNKSSDYIKEFAIAMLKTLGLSLKVCFRHGFDVVHAANPPDTFFAIGLLYRLFGKKYVYDQHDLAPEVFHVRFQDRMRPLYKLLRFFEWCSYHTANLVITTNESQKGKAVTRGGADEENVFVVRNGPDLARYIPTTPEPALKHGRRYLLAYIGVMGQQDGVEYTLEAVHELVHKRGRQDVSLVLMGDGDQLPSLQALAKKLQLEEYVHFAGWVERRDMLRYLTMTDIGLVPDPSNELNDTCTMLKTMEYMAMGKALVSFDMPENRFSAQEAALYATPNLVEDFADKIETLLDNEALRIKMGAFGRKRVEEELSWDRTRVNLWRAYEKLFSSDPKDPKLPIQQPADETGPRQTADPVSAGN